MKRLTGSERISRLSTSPTMRGCRLWTGAINGDGYGRVGIDCKNLAAHRISYEVANGPIPDGLEIDHLCGERSCVEPSHLEAVTHKENVLRGNSFSAVNARKASCIYGHPLPAGRKCLECHAKIRAGHKYYMRSWRAKNREV